MRGRFFRWAVVLLMILSAAWPVSEAEPFPRFYRNGTHPTTEWNGIHLIARQTGKSGWGADVTLEYWRDQAGRWREEVIDASVPATIGTAYAYDGSRMYRIFPAGNLIEATPQTDPVDVVSGFFNPVEALMLREDVRAGRATARTDTLNGAQVVLIESTDAERGLRAQHWINPELGLILKKRVYKHGAQVSTFDVIHIDWTTPLPPFPEI